MPNPYQMDPAQVEHEARAKVFWGDPPEEVIKFLRIQGFSYEEAAGLVEEMMRERRASIRGAGISKVLIGVALMAVPVGAYCVFVSIGVMSLKLFGIAIVIGLGGAYLFLKGAVMLFAPQTESGDVSDK